MNQQTDFTRGPYGEILAPPLMAGLDDEDALAILDQDARDGGNPINSMPSRGDSRTGMLVLARMYAHHKNLKRALAGQLGNDPDGMALYQAVTQQGEPISIRPVGMEHLAFSTFAPVLRREGENKWRVGLEGNGRTAVIEGTPDVALDQVSALYVRWCEDEETRFSATVDKLLQAVPHSINHDVWAVAIRQAQSVTPRQSVPIAESVVLFPGRHSTFVLQTAKGQRVIDASSPERAARIAEAVAKQTRSPIAYPTAESALHALMVAGEWETLTHTAQQITLAGKGKNAATVTWEPRGQEIGTLSTGERKGRLYLAKSEIEAHWYVDRRNPMTVAKSSLCPNVKEWLKTNEGRLVIMAWAALKLSNAKNRRSS